MSSTSKSTPKKDNLVKIAGDLFYYQGFAATGIKQIIEKAGVAKGTFYSHFESKEELGIAWLQKYYNLWQAILDDLGSSGEPPQRKILSLFDILTEWMENYDFRGCLFLNTLAELPKPTGEMRHIIHTHKKNLRNSIYELTQAHFADKPKDFSRHKADVIYLFFESALVESQNFRELWPIQVARKETEHTLNGPSLH